MNLAQMTAVTTVLMSRVARWPRTRPHGSTPPKLHLMRTDPAALISRPGASQEVRFEADGREAPIRHRGDEIIASKR